MFYLSFPFFLNKSVFEEALARRASQITSYLPVVVKVHSVDACLVHLILLRVLPHQVLQILLLELEQSPR